MLQTARVTAFALSEFLRENKSSPLPTHTQIKVKHLLSTEGSCILKQTCSFQLQVCLCINYLWALGVKGSILNIEFLLPFTQPAFTFSKLTITTLEKGVKHVKSRHISSTSLKFCDVVLSNNI